MSKLLITISIWPSNNGWQAELNLIVIPERQNNFEYNWSTNTLSQSDTIVLGYPCNLTTSQVNNFAACHIVNRCPRGKKWEYLVFRSTTTITVLNPFTLGSYSMKFIDMSSHTKLGILSGCNKPIVLKVLYLFCWHTSQ